ncbi:MAG: HD domain-containing protein [Bacteroidetes bacterium]|nr:HD domain-containing protein [Bacteroidota bacterium]
MAAETTLTEKASAWVFKHFSGKLDDRYTYHNFTHTTEVVDAVVRIGEESGLSGHDLEVVVLAAWFHDTGITEVYEHHEEKSAEIAERFLKKHACDRDSIDAVKRCILVTALDAQPMTLQEKVICDADLAHIGKKDFWTRSAFLRDEWAVLRGEHFTDREWLEHQIAFLDARRFFTEIAQSWYQQRLEKNRAKLRLLLQEVEQGIPLAATGDEEKEAKKKKEKQKKKKKEGKDPDDLIGRGDRGVETMFRITARNHVNFSAMVDSKANIMISINALVISVIISVLFRKLDSNPYMAIPTFLFLAVCLTTIVFAVLASRPKVTTGVFTREDITQKRANLLFFGNFYNVPVNDFEWGMRELLKDKDYLYGSMIRDFYYLGQVLGRKYQYLRISYNVFMYGFVCSILLYVIMFLVFAEQPIDLVPLSP